MTTSRRNLLWPTIMIVVGLLWLLMVMGTLPEAAGDILLRAWPALLVIFGFDVLVGRRRVRLGRWRVQWNSIGLVVVVIALAGLVWLAYNKQATVARADQIKTFSEPLPENITRLRIEITVDRTWIVVSPETTARELKAEFKGSRDSEVEMLPTIEGDTYVLKVTEQRTDAISKLEDYGRGTLTLSLPAVSIEKLAVTVNQGDVSIDLLPLNAAALALTLGKGDLKLGLPAQGALFGELKVEDGAIELSVADSSTLTLKVEGDSLPAFQYDPSNYEQIVGGPVQSTKATGDNFQIGLKVWTKNGASLIIKDVVSN
jgi:hypothetical protein